MVHPLVKEARDLLNQFRKNPQPTQTDMILLIGNLEMVINLLEKLDGEKRRPGSKKKDLDPIAQRIRTDTDIAGRGYEDKK